MEISIEAFAVTNLVMNAVIIGIIARSRGRVSLRRVAFASGFGTLYAIAMQSGWYPQLNAAPAKLMLAAMLSIAAFPVESWTTWMICTLLLLGGTVFVGGICEMIVELFGRSGISLLSGNVLGCGALAAALEARGRKIEKFEAQVYMSRSGRQIRLNALIDTGNRLHEPISGLPVMIVEEKLVRRLLPAVVNPQQPEKYLPRGFRLVSYGVLGGKGQMVCFQPDELLVSYGEGWMRAPDVWVAVYPGTIPGSAHALAPAVIGRIAQVEDKTKISGGERGRLRWSIPHSRQ